MYYEKDNPSDLFDMDSEKYRLIIEKIKSSNDFKKDNYHQEWQNVVFQALTATTIAVLSNCTQLFSLLHLILVLWVASYLLHY